MVFRHPHVFSRSGSEGVDAKTVSENWELRKLKERAGKHILDGVPESAPSVLKAMQIQRKVRDVGFDWDPERMEFANGTGKGIPLSRPGDSNGWEAKA